MKTYHYYDAPLKVFGLPDYEKSGILRRLPPEVTEKVPTLSFLGRRPSGGRIGFRTDAERFMITVKLESMTPDRGISIYACQSVQVLAGERMNPRFVGLVHPNGYDHIFYSGTVEKGPGMEDVLLYLPRNEVVTDIWVDIDDGASIEPPTPYPGKPVAFYGSSITETGCATNQFGSYEALLSNRMDFDFYNLGFSGSARGELPIADYINTLDLSAFVLDYDHNAPDSEFLKATHEPFFRRVREAHPEWPILMMSMPAEKYNDTQKCRREIIRATYQHAVDAGDDKVWFVDGETFFGDNDRHLCTIDGTHPNDLGFYRMACTIAPVLQEMLGKFG